MLTSTDQIKFNSLKVVNDLQVFQDLDKLNQSGYVVYDDFVDTIEITEKMMKICLSLEYLGYQSSGWAEYCVNIDMKYVDKLEYYSINSLDFKVNAFPTDMSSFTMYINPRDGLKEYKLSLKGAGWNNKGLKEKINVNYGKNKIRIAVTNPGQANNLNLVGNGSKLFTINYVKPQKYCVYAPNADKTCYSNTSISTIQIENNEDVIKNILSINNISVQLTIDNSDKPLKIPFSFFNN